MMIRWLECGLIFIWLCSGTLHAKSQASHRILIKIRHSNRVEVVTRLNPSNATVEQEVSWETDNAAKKITVHRDPDPHHEEAADDNQMVMIIKDRTGKIKIPDASNDNQTSTVVYTVTDM